MNTKIVLIMDGGLIHEVLASRPVEVLTLDHDLEGGDPECIREIPQGDSSPTRVYVRFEEVTVHAGRLRRLWKAASTSPV